MVFVQTQGIYPSYNTNDEFRRNPPPPLTAVFFLPGNFYKFSSWGSFEGSDYYAKSPSLHILSSVTSDAAGNSPQEEIVRLWRKASVLEQAEEVVVLSVDVT